MTRSPRDFFRPLAIGAPSPRREIPVFPSRMLHFFDPSVERMRDRVAATANSVDVLVGNLEDAVPVERKTAAREGLATFALQSDVPAMRWWVRVNALDSPWVLDDLDFIARELAGRVGVIMIPKVQSDSDVLFVDRQLALLEARYGVAEQFLVHAVLETAAAMSNIEEICVSSPRLQGVSLGPADMAADRRMKTTRAGGPHPDYLVRADPSDHDVDGQRPTYLQDLWHYTIARMVDACVSAGITPYYGPFGDIQDVVGCADQFRNAYLLGCAGAWTLHPVQIEIARRIFTPSTKEVDWARRVLAAAATGVSAIMIDGKMQDDATFKQCRVIVDLADRLAELDGPAAVPSGTV